MSNTISTSSHRRSTSRRSIRLAASAETEKAASSNDENEEPDLFDYFDPLLSPHAYPDGISSAPKPQGDSQEEKAVPTKKAPFSAFGISLPLQSAADKEAAEKSQPEKVPITSTTTSDEESPDLFEYFDPLLSPHAYPDGIKPTGATTTTTTTTTRPLEVVDQATEEEDGNDRYNPLKFPKYVENVNRQASGSKSSFTFESESESKPPQKIGILLMDHGSRNAASNERLQRLAELYQLTLDDDTIVVTAAHMEITSPTIQDGLETLLQHGVGK
jgi:hypothetical protein